MTNKEILSTLENEIASTHVILNERNWCLMLELSNSTDIRFMINNSKTKSGGFIRAKYCVMYDKQELPKFIVKKIETVKSALLATGRYQIVF